MMKRNIGLLVLLLASAAATLSAEAVEYQLVPAEGNRFTLEVHKTGLMSGKSHIFEFSRYSGTVRFDEAAPENSQVRLTIAADSAECKDDWVKPKQLADIEKYAFEDMMKVKEFPAIVFESERVTAAAEGAFTVTGPLKIRDKSMPVSVAVMVRRDGATIIFEGSAIVNLSDYEIKPKKAALGMIGTRSAMDVTFRLATVDH